MSATAPRQAEYSPGLDSIPSFTAPFDEKFDIKQNRTLTQEHLKDKINFSISSPYQVTKQEVLVAEPQGIPTSFVHQVKLEKTFIKIPGFDPIPLVATYSISPGEQINKLNLMMKVVEDVYRIFGNNDFNVSVEIPAMGDGKNIGLSRNSSILTIYDKFYTEPRTVNLNELPKAYLEIPGCNWFPIYEFTWKKLISFIITEQTLKNLEAKNIPDEILKKLESLKDEKIPEEKFLDCLRIVVGHKRIFDFYLLVRTFAKISYEGSTLESKECGAFPKIKLEYEGSDFLNLKAVRRWSFSVANNSLQALILYTRLTHSIVTKRTLTLNFLGLLKATINFPEASLEDFNETLLLASLYRKLRFLEIVFHCKFKFQEISHRQMLLIDEIFRGVTEGTFWTRSAGITLPNLTLTREEVTHPPYTSTASIGASVKEVKFDLLGSLIPVGNITFYLNKAELIDDLKNSLIDKVFKNPNQTYNVPFAILDHQICYEYEDYLQSNKKAQIQELLTKFQQNLGRQEPDDLVDLLNQPLLGTVDEKEVQDIAKGWLLYSGFSYSLFITGKPQPTENDSWRIPILWRPFPESEIEIGEINISNGGSVLNHTNLQKIRARSVEASIKLREKGIAEYSYYEEQPHRAIIFVKQVNSENEKDSVEVIIPSWDPEKIIKFSKELIEDIELANNLKAEMLLSAEVKMAAKNINDITLKNFLLVTTPDLDNDIFPSLTYE